MNQTNDRRGGCYFIGQQPPYISVTEITSKIIDKPQLRYWYGKMVYEEVIKNPYIDEAEALAAPSKATRKAANRGTTIHSLIEAHKKTGVVIETVPDELKGYASAFYDWTSKNNLEILESERTVFNEEYKYAGTLDMLAKLNGETVVLDFKTNKTATIYDEAHLQVSAYQHSLPEMYPAYIVALAPDGTWTQSKARDAFNIFLHALSVYAFINQEKLQKWGWKGKYV